MEQRRRWECGTQEHWKHAIFSGYQRGFKNANGTGPLKYACHKVELVVVAAEAGAGVESHKNPPPRASSSDSPLPSTPCFACRRECLFTGAWECWTQRSLPNLGAPP